MKPENTNGRVVVFTRPSWYNSVVSTHWDRITPVRIALAEGTIAVRPRHQPDIDRQVAEHALTLLARKRTKMPLTAGFMQAVALQGFNHRVGEHRAAKMISHLKRNGSLVQVGRYRGRIHGFWVPIYRLRTPSALRIASIRRNSAVKGRAWWQHGLFGNPGGEKPLFAAEKDLRRWRSKPHRALEFARSEGHFPAAPLQDLNLWEGRR